MSVNTLNRVFKIGATEVVDPNPSLELSEAIRLLVPRFPTLRLVTIYPEDGQLKDGNLVYDVEIPLPKTKG